MTKAQDTLANNLFNRAQEETGGRLIELARYLHGTVVTVHVAYWQHDTEGHLIIGENWHETE